MNPLSIDLHLKGHCIETAVKKKLRHLTEQFYNTDDNPDILLKKIELLQTFLKNNDFSRMRVEDERLSGDKETYVRIYKNNANILMKFM